MSKGQSPEQRAADGDRRDKLMLLAAGFFAVRLYRSPVGLDREVEAKSAALDAAALLKAVEALPL